MSCSSQHPTSPHDKELSGFCDFPRPQPFGRPDKSCYDAFAHSVPLVWDFVPLSPLTDPVLRGRSFSSLGIQLPISSERKSLLAQSQCRQSFLCSPPFAQLLLSSCQVQHSHTAGCPSVPSLQSRNSALFDPLSPLGIISSELDTC